MVTPFVAATAVAAKPASRVNATTSRERCSARRKPARRNRYQPTSASAVLPNAIAHATPIETPLVAFETSAERDRGPELRPADEERRDRDAGRRPHGRDHPVRDGKLETELRCPEVEARNRRDFDCLPRPLACQDADRAARPLTELDFRGRTPSGRKVASDLAGRQLPKG